MALLASCIADGAGQLVLPTITGPDGSSELSTEAVPGQPIRVFWITSYGSDDPWSLQIRTGIWEVLARSGYSVAGDTLVWESRDLGFSHLASEESVAVRVTQTAEAVRRAAPDVVIVSDDEAIDAIVPLLSLDRVAVVACGLSAPAGPGPEVSGLVDGVAAVVEPLRPLQTVAMAREFTGGTGPYLVVGDDSLSGRRAVDVAYETLAQAGIEADLRKGAVGAWAEWQDLLVSEADGMAFVLVAAYRPLPDQDGEAIDSRKMMAWMLETLDVPVFSLVNSVVVDGAVGGLVADGYEQGRLAGEYAMAVTQDRHVADELWAIGASRLVVNAAAARHWGLSIPALFPIAAEVYRSLPPVPSQPQALYTRPLFRRSGSSIPAGTVDSVVHVTDAGLPSVVQVVSSGDQP